MASILNSAAMLKTTRLCFGLLAVSFGLALGCSNEKAEKPPELVPSVHPGGKLPSPALPASFGSSRSAPSDAPAFDQITAVLAEHELFTRVIRLSELLQQLGPEAIHDIKMLLKVQHHHNMDAAEMALLTRFWALHEPKEATEWAMSLPSQDLSLLLVPPAIEVWAIRDPLAAANSLVPAGIYGSPNKGAALRGMIAGWFQSEVPGLEQFIRVLPMGNSRQSALRFLSRLMIEEYGPQATIDWAVSLPEDADKFKLNAYRQLGQELGLTHPAYAVEFCAAYCNSEVGDSVRQMIAQSWANRDGPAAMAWVKDNFAETPDAGKRIVVTAAFRGFQQIDRPACYAWMESIGPDGVEEWLQPAVEMYAINIAPTDVHHGLEWAGAVADERDRARVLTTIAIRWRKRDPESADAWLASSELTEADRDRVRLYGQRGTMAELRMRIEAAESAEAAKVEVGEDMEEASQE